MVIAMATMVVKAMVAFMFIAMNESYFSWLENVEQRDTMK